jgi:hypothetical protein
MNSDGIHSLLNARVISVPGAVSQGARRATEETAPAAARPSAGSKPCSRSASLTMREIRVVRNSAVREYQFQSGRVTSLSARCDTNLAL